MWFHYRSLSYRVTYGCLTNILVECRYDDGLSSVVYGVELIQ